MSKRKPDGPLRRLRRVSRGTLPPTRSDVRNAAIVSGLTAALLTTLVTMTVHFFPQKHVVNKSNTETAKNMLEIADRLLGEGESLDPSTRQEIMSMLKSISFSLRRDLEIAEVGTAGTGLIIPRTTINPEGEWAALATPTKEREAVPGPKPLGGDTERVPAALGARPSATVEAAATHAAAPIISAPSDPPPSDTGPDSPAIVEWSYVDIYGITHASMGDETWVRSMATVKQTAFPSRDG